MKNKSAVVSLSGGMDSTTLLLRALDEYENVIAISFDYGQKHKIELERAQDLIEYIKLTSEEIAKKLQYSVVRLEGLSSMLNSHLVEGGEDVPEGHYEQSNMKATVVPNRNKIFSSLVQAVALSQANKTGTPCDILLGIHAGDHCFTEDTNILTPNGVVPFKELSLGDSIYSYNLETNELEEDKVTDIIRKNVVENIRLINTSAGDLKVTDEHKVYKVSLENYDAVRGYDKSIIKVPAKEISPGDMIVSPIGAKVLSNKVEPVFDTSGYDYEPPFSKVLDVTVQEHNDYVYDITVQNNNNFFAGSLGQILISNSIYPDCRQEFRDLDYQAFLTGNWNAEKVSYYTPYLTVGKYEILLDGQTLCTKLGLHFNEVYKRTNTSYKPYPSGNSDIFSGSSIERIEAFIKLGRPDPVQYEDETGPVSWEVVKEKAQKVINDFSKKRKS